MNAFLPPLHPASLLMQDGTPLSDAYGDVYFSRHDGMAESEYVYLKGNDLEQRFTACTTQFTIAETGFGTGLNYYLTAHLWMHHAPKSATLHYISIEKHPFQLQDMIQLSAAHPPLTAYAEALHAVYPPVISGVHQRRLHGGRIRLTLLFSDIADALPVIQAQSVDAWFLDGFAPAKNPDMWQEAHLQVISTCTRTGGTVATFTAAGAVKRALAQGGFTMHKRDGWGYKRDMLVGVKGALQGTEHDA